MKPQKVEMSIDKFEQLRKRNEVEIKTEEQIFQIMVKTKSCPRCNRKEMRLIKCRICGQYCCSLCNSWTNQFGNTCFDCRIVTSSFLEQVNRYRDSFTADHIEANDDGTVSCLECVDSKEAGIFCKFHKEDYQIRVGPGRKK